MIRLLIVVALLSFGWYKGGWWGLYAMLLVSGLVLAMIGPPRPKEEPEEFYDEITPARKGREADPTRPTTDDFAGMIEYRKGK